MTKRVFDFADGFTSESNPTSGANYVGANQGIGSGGEIALGSTAGSVQVLLVSGDGAATSTSNTPFGSTPPSSGNIIILIGTDDTNTLTITGNDSADGVIHNGGGDIVLRENDAVMYIYIGVLDRYIELSINF